MQREGGREGSVRNDLLPLLALIFFKEFCRFVKMTDFYFEVFFPQFLDSAVGLGHIAGPIQIALGIFVPQQHFEPGCLRVHKRLILCHMLLFNKGNLLIKPP